MKTLALDTSGNVCSVCLLEDNKILYESNIVSGFTHSVILFNEIKLLLNKNNICIEDIDYIAVSNGPGSYTGLRIGIACAIGLSKPHNTKIKYVDTLVGIIYNVKELSDDNTLICAIIDAKADRVYCKQYINNNFTENKIINIYDLINELNNIHNKKIIFVGDGVKKYYELIKNDLKIDYIIYEDKLYQKASSIGLASLDDYTINEKVDINYMQKSQAERELNATNN